MESIMRIALLGALVALLPGTVCAQGLAEEMNGMHAVLEQLYNQMMPLCSQLIGVAQVIAGFAATWYIAARVWKHIANAEAIDFYPLFRPFVIGFCIMIFPSVLGLINGIMKPTVTGTANMVEGSNAAISQLLEMKMRAMMESEVWQMYVGETGFGDRDRWYKYTHEGADPSDEGFIAGIGNDVRFALERSAYNLKSVIKFWLSELLRILFEAAALCIDTLRTFQLVVLSILGPLVFGLAVFDGFQHTLTVWLARYINIFLWLPVANIFGSIIGKIQQEMLKLDIAQIQAVGDTFFDETDIAYLVFMIIGIVGYFTVPSVANYIVHAGGGGALQQKVTNLFYSSTTKTARSVTYGAGMAADALGDSASQMSRSMPTHGRTSEYFDEKLRGK